MIEPNADNSCDLARSGRDHRGRFVKGCRGGPGNPHARRVFEVREAMLACVTEEDIRAVTRRLIESAKAGDVSAAKVLFDRVFGKPSAAPLFGDSDARPAGSGVHGIQQHIVAIINNMTETVVGQGRTTSSQTASEDQGLGEHG